MKTCIYSIFALFVVFGLGCAVTNYPVILDSSGPWGDSVMDSFYDQAYIIPTSQIATLYPDGTDELYTTVVQDNRADQWLYTYNNFDPSGVNWFVDQTYCDPTRQSNCAIVTAWNPDLPEVYPHGDQTNTKDDPFDHTLDKSCSGARSLSMMISDKARIGECGSGIMADPQATAYEFSLLERGEFRGRAVYALPLDSSVASFVLTSFDNGVSEELPIYGRFMAYLDEKLRLAIPVTPTMDYQRQALNRFISRHGNRLQIDLTYGALSARYEVEVQAF